MTNNLNKKVKKIRADFISSIPRRANRIKQLTNDLINNDWDANKAKHLMSEIHNLRGLSGHQGLLNINELAGIAENMVEFLRNNDHELDPKQKEELHNKIDNLINMLDKIDSDLELDMPNNQVGSTKTTSSSPLVLIVDDDQDFCSSLSAQVENLGYDTIEINNLEDLESNIIKYKPQAIFMDIVFNGKRAAGIDHIKDLQNKNMVDCSIVYMSGRDDLEARLEAVRSGGEAFLTKTFSLQHLKSILDSTVPLQTNINYKVLIIEDDKTAAEYCSAILEHANIETVRLTQQMEVFDTIIEFDPDVILLDMYMPEIDGFEMASIIRQHQTFSSIPIVIMSSETDVNKQFKMRSLGADDFILKPFQPHHLVDTIFNRIKRSKYTKHMIYTDGLTGLMLFSKFKEQIHTLMESCLRYNLDFSVGLIDLDYFKNINDQYGHLAGDQILREFSEFLSTRVRKSDIVTRYGGEEFAIIFPYTSGENAVRALNSMREAFSRRLKHSNIGEFHITFSGGVASIIDYQDLDALLLAADKALYKAKGCGRNHIEISSN